MVSLPYDVIRVIAVCDGDQVRTVSIVIGEHILGVAMIFFIERGGYFTLVKMTGIARKMERNQTTITTLLQLPRVQTLLE